MPRRVSLTDDAVDDLAAIRRWHRQPGSGASARRRVEAIIAAIERLREAPCLFRRGDRPGTRRMVVKGYSVVYRVDPDTGDNQSAGDVLVIRVFGPGQRQEP